MGIPEEDRWLFPLHRILHEESLHFNDVMTKGTHLIFINIINEIHKGSAHWRTEGQWIKYLKMGNRGDHTPSFIPKDSDFVEGMSIIKRGFHITWNGEFLRDLTVPEVFIPLVDED
jgi:hypothetical protein